jgi:flagellar FliJ protein
MAGPFKLQTVLNHRQRLEDIAAQRLSAALAREAALQRQLGEKRTAFDQLLGEFTGRQKAGISVHELQVYRHSIQRGQDQLKTLAGQAEQLVREVESCRRQLTEICRKKKLLEKLKEHHQEEQLYQDNQKEMAQLDEIALRLRMTDI